MRAIRRLHDRDDQLCEEVEKILMKMEELLEGAGGLMTTLKMAEAHVSDSLDTLPLTIH